MLSYERYGAAVKMSLSLRLLYQGQGEFGGADVLTSLVHEESFSSLEITIALNCFKTYFHGYTAYS